MADGQTLPLTSSASQAFANWERERDALRAEIARLTKELAGKQRERSPRIPAADLKPMADLGQMAAHVAHEIRNNLLPVVLNWQLLRRRLQGAEGANPLLDKIESGLAAVDAAVHDLSHFTAPRGLRRQTVNVRELVREVVAAIGPRLQAQAVRPLLNVPHEQSISADRDLLGRAVLNLAMNALDAMPDGGELVITSHLGSAALELEIADSGRGLDGDLRQRAFEPFFSTKDTAAGLGLTIVRRIAEAHDGDVSVVNCPDGGAAFTLRIPRQPVALRVAA